MRKSATVSESVTADEVNVGDIFVIYPMGTALLNGAPVYGFPEETRYEVLDVQKDLAGGTRVRARNVETGEEKEQVVPAGSTMTVQRVVSMKKSALSGECMYCGVQVTYKAPEGEFGGGYVTDDGWGTLCMEAPDHNHVVAPLWGPGPLSQEAGMDADNWPRCQQCGKTMTPADAAINPVCMDCAKKNHREVVGSLTPDMVNPLSAVAARARQVLAEDDFDPSRDWLETCNACEVRKAIPGDPAGYCEQCKAEAQKQGSRRTAEHLIYYVVGGTFSDAALGPFATREEAEEISANNPGTSVESMPGSSFASPLHEHIMGIEGSRKTALPMVPNVHGPSYADGFIGDKYQPYRDTKDIAAEVRKEIKDLVSQGKIPGPPVKYSVTIQRFSGGSSCDISVKNWPRPESIEVPDGAPAPEGYTFHSGGYANSRIYRDTESVEVLATLNALLDAHRRDMSDSMTDYYETNFYGRATIDWSTAPRQASRRVVAEQNWTEVGSKFNRGEVKNQIAALEWHEVGEGTMSLPMMPGEGIKKIISEFRIPNVTRVAWNGVLQNRYGFYGIEGNYSNGRVRIYIVDQGSVLTPVMSENLGLDAEGVRRFFATEKDDASQSGNAVSGLPTVEENGDEEPMWPWEIGPVENQGRTSVGRTAAAESGLVSQIKSGDRVQIRDRGNRLLLGGDITVMPYEDDGYITFMPKVRMGYGDGVRVPLGTPAAQTSPGEWKVWL